MNHSVTLDKYKCKGCTTCIKHCPTEAIRVRCGRAQIIEDRCIDCGECIRVCPHKAKKAVCDPLEKLGEFKFNVALPAPSLYAQFSTLYDVNVILNGLLEIGFDMIAETSRGAEIISEATRKLLDSDKTRPRPMISSACPAAVRLICMRFPKLIPNIVPFIAPFEVAGIKAREDAVKATGLAPNEIGVFFITPCPAKVTSIRYPMGLDTPAADGAISMTEVYKKLLAVMKKTKKPKALSQSGKLGVSWARAGGEASALKNHRCLSIEGIENIIRTLEDVENGMLPPTDFLELNACNQGCVGGCLAAENPYVAKARVLDVMERLPESRLEPGAAETEELVFSRSLEHTPTWKLDADLGEAIKKAARIEKLCKELPGLDCGSCGAPSCRALAEDIVLGLGAEDDCIFRVRERMHDLTGAKDADSYLPPPFRHRGEEER